MIGSPRSAGSSGIERAEASSRFSSSTVQGAIFERRRSDLGRGPNAWQGVGPRESSPRDMAGVAFSPPGNRKPARRFVSRRPFRTGNRRRAHDKARKALHASLRRSEPPDGPCYPASRVVARNTSHAQSLAGLAHETSVTLPICRPPRRALSFNEGQHTRENRDRKPLRGNHRCPGQPWLR